MGRHLTPAIRTFVRSHASKKSARQILAACRKKGWRWVSLRQFSSCLAGKSFNKVIETRGRRGPSASEVKRILASRAALIKQFANVREVTLEMIRRRSRVKLSRSVISRLLTSHGIAWRRSRPKPLRCVDNRAARLAKCVTWACYPSSFWTNEVDAYIDCKRYRIPLSARTRCLRSSARIRGHHRLRSEGLHPDMTTVNLNKHGTSESSAWVFAAVTGGRLNKFIVWSYITGRWNRFAACSMYRVLCKALRQHRPLRGSKKFWRIVEDGDPSGFKSHAAVDLKKRLRIRTLDLPPYSPDLQPLDYTLWHQVSKAVEATAERRQIKTAVVYRQVLRTSALKLSRLRVKSALKSMHNRIRAIVAAKGGHVSRD